MIGRENEVKAYRSLARNLSYLVLAGFSILLVRLYYLQGFSGEQLRRYSEANRLKQETIFPRRGIIYDREGRVIVDNRASFDVVVIGQYYPFTEEVNRRLAKILEMKISDLEERLQKAQRSPKFYSTLIKADVSKDIIAAIEMDAQGFPGVNIESTVTRRYPFGDLMAQTLGYVGEVSPQELERYPQLRSGDYIGKGGLERVYDDHLRGIDGVGYVEVDARGRRRSSETGRKLLGFVNSKDPVAGDNLHLTIDLDLQTVAAAAMKERGFLGSVVAVDPRTGELLAMVSLPSYEPAAISGREVEAKLWNTLRQDEDRPLRNRTIQDHYPPGSTFKLITAIAGLAEGVIDPKRTRVHCPGYFFYGGRKYNCWLAGGHGDVDFFQAIRESCNVFFYKMGLQLGIDKIAKYGRLFGLGSRLGIRLPSETPGLIPDRDWKLKTYGEPWQLGENLSVAIGQGFVTVTPLQLAMAYATIGNQGFLYRPYIVKTIEGRSGDTLMEHHPELLKRIDVPLDVFAAAKEGLFEVVNSAGGTAYFRARSQKTVISGKTGTAQVKRFHDIMATKCEHLDFKSRQHGWFVGYAPREKPEIAVVALGEHNCHGHVSAPIVKAVVEAYMDKREQDMDRARSVATEGEKR